MRIGPIGPRALLSLAGVVMLAIGGWLAFDRYAIYLPGLIQDMRDPIAANQPVSWAAGPDTADGRSDLPNIVLIVADDLGWNDISLHGGVAAGKLATPNIDRIAAEGVQLTQAYSASGTCAPSRAALMTGRYPTRFGFEFTPMPPAMARIISRQQARQPSDPPFVFHSVDQRVSDFADMAMPPSEIALPELLGRAGYHSVLIGKWHLGGSEGSDPLSQGFDESLELAGLLHAPAGGAGVVEARQDFDPIDEVYWAAGRAAVRSGKGGRFAPDGYLTDYLSREAVRVIEANRNRPFFLYLAHWAPHSPLQAKREDYEALAGIEDHATRVYAAMIRALDRSVGEVLATLDVNGLSGNTIIIFTSDNGGAHYIGIPGINDPYRGWKATFFDGGVRVPTFMRWPGQIAPGSRMEGLAHHTDIFPTLAAIARANLPADRVMDGRNWLPFINGTAQGAPHETLYWRSGHYRAVIHQGWKLHISDRPQRIWLFDLANDPYERVDLSASEPARVKLLTSMLDQHDAAQAKPLWPSIAEMPVNLDRPLSQARKQGDEYVYWPN